MIATYSVYCTVQWLKASHTVQEEDLRGMDVLCQRRHHTTNDRAMYNGKLFDGPATIFAVFPACATRHSCTGSIAGLSNNWFLRTPRSLSLVAGSGLLTNEI